MGKARRNGVADSDGFRPVRGRSSSRARARSASGARDSSKTRATTNTFKWECWGTFAGRRCGKQCVGVQNCTHCGRSAPDKAWAVKVNREPNGPASRRKRSPSRPRKGGSEAESAELAKLRREVEQAKSDSIKQTREMRELRAAFEARADAPAVSQEVSAPST